MLNIFRQKRGTGAIEDPVDIRDYSYDEIAAAGEPVDWDKGFDVEKELKITIPTKNQDGSGSCVGQGVSYYVATLNAVEVGFYDEQSAKAIYSQIELGLPGGGAYIRDGMKLIVNWGSVKENIVPSYDNGRPPKEDFIRDKTWKTPAITEIAKIMQAKEYRVINAANNMDTFAMAIRDNYGVVGGVRGSNNGSWNGLEPKPSPNPTWGHCLKFGKFGTDRLGRFIATPNSWGSRGKDELHPDGWQKLREDFFTTEFMFNPWTLVDKPNIIPVSPEVDKITNNYEKQLIIEGEGPGRKGIIVAGKLRQITKERAAEAALYVMANNNLGITISTKLFNELPKDTDF